MGVIKVLDEQISQLIAAGEVVERPSSVVKELIENSIDAGASQITVEIRHGGVTLIRVSDNGSGIQPDDVQTMFLRHATSKVRTQEDLSCIATLGFRGEAMASIHAVSRVEVLTRRQNSDEGICYRGEGEQIGETTPAGCPAGTTVKVSDLFFNTPARMKFLKKDAQEGNSVAGVVEKIALSHPEISFRFVREGQTKLHTPGDGKLLSAIHAVYGKDFTKGLIKVNYQHGQIAVKGYITLPTMSRSNRTMQTFFVNGRYVKSVTARTALEEAYKHSLMVGKFPGCVLQLELPLTDTDINVHPAKIEIRFTDERPVFDAVYYAVKSSLAEQDNTLLNPAPTKKPMTIFDLERRPEVEQTTLPNVPQSKQPQRMSAQEYQKLIEEEKRKSGNKLEKGRNLLAEKGMTVENLPDIELSVQDSYTGTATTPPKMMLPPSAFPKRRNEQRQEPYRERTKWGNEASEKVPSLFPKVSEEPIKPASPVLKQQENIPEVKKEAAELEERIEAVIEKVPQPKLEQENLRLVGEVLGTYLVVESKDRMILIDKHAAHERLIFNKLKKQDFTSQRQLLLEPVMVHLSQEDYQGASRGLELFQQAGFLVEDFGDGDLIVREVPTMLSGTEICEVVEQTAHALSNHKKDLTPQALDDLLHSVACKSAVRANDKNSQIELLEIVKLLCEDENAKYCPHGRPIAKSFSRRELEKMFGRLG